MSSLEEILTRKIEREKKARLAAEAKLEEYSRNIYLTQQELEKNQRKTEQRKQDLEFLHATASHVNSNLSLTELLNESVRTISLYTKAQSATWFTVGEDGELIAESPVIWSCEDKWSADNSDLTFIHETFLTCGMTQQSKWVLVPMSDDEFTADQIGMTTFLPLPSDSSHHSVIAFMYAEDLLEEEKLYALDTARDHIVSGVKRRLSEQKIQHRNKQLQEAVSRLKIAQKQLIQSEKMASLGQLAAGVAHEINNPIGFVRSNLQVLGDYHQTFNKAFDAVNEAIMSEMHDKSTLLELAAQFELKDLLQDSQAIIKTNLNGIDRVKAIVDGLRTFSHAGEDNQSLISVEECLGSALQMVNNELKYKHQLDYQIPDQLPQIVGNSNQIQQVFINLFINAADAMENGGILRVIAQYQNEAIVVTVADNGSGMSDDVKNKLFTPFFTTKAVGSGTGLGLSIVSAILEAHDVQIKVDSEINKGTCFTLRFPVANSV